MYPCHIHGIHEHFTQQVVWRCACLMLPCRLRSGGTRAVTVPHQ